MESKGRIIIGINTFVCLMVLFAQRVNINVVITQIVSITNENNKIHWTGNQKSYTLMSYYGGFMITQIYGGIMAEKYGPKIVLGICVVMSSILCLVSPFALEKSPIALSVVRILMGAANGPYFPAVNVIISNWYPPSSRSRAVGFIIPGMQFGSIMGFSITSALAVNNALWKYSFYLFGGIGFVWLIFWIIFMTDYYNDNKWTTEAEKHYLSRTVERKQSQTKISYKKVIKSIPVYAVISFHFQSFWNVTFVLTLIPSFIKDIYYIPVKHQTYITFLLPILMWISGLFACFISDYLLKNNIISKINIRRLFATMACLPVSLFLMFSTLINPNIFYWGILLILISSFAIGIQIAVIIPNIADIAPQYCGVISGISNTVSSIGAILSIQVTYIIVSDTHNLREWQIVFAIMITTQTIIFLIFLIFARSSKQNLTL